DLLAAHGRRILAGDAADEIGSDDPTSPALERKREVEYQLRLYDLAEREGQLVSLATTRQCFTVAAAIFKQYAETVQRKFGADALDLWNQTLAGWERSIDQLFGDKAAQE